MTADEDIGELLRVLGGAPPGWVQEAKGIPARELTRVAETLSGRGRGLAGMQLGLTPSSKF